MIFAYSKKQSKSRYGIAEHSLQCCMNKAYAIYIYLSVLQEIRRKDDNSLLLKISYQGSVFILVSIYGPNSHCPPFFDNLLNDFQVLGDFPIIICGDWNCTISPLPPLNNPDTINMNSIPNKRHSTYLQNMCNTANLIDPFRAKFPNRKEFMYFPSDPTKRNRSRIDFFIISF